MASELDNILIEVSYMFENRYGAIWVGPSDDFDRDSLHNKLHSWKMELDNVGVEPSEIMGTAKMLLRKGEYKDYPPNLNAFINSIREYSLMFSRGDTSKYYIEVKKLDEIFYFTYGRIWSESDQDKHRRKLEFWMNELISSEIPSDVLLKASKLVCAKTEFRTFPPSLNHFLLECKFALIGEVLSSPESQYFLAAEGQYDKLDIIANSVLSIIGTSRIKMQYDGQIRKNFTELYYKQAKIYTEQPSLFINVNKDDLQEEKDDAVIADACPDFFNSFKLNP
jgi:hypothetical protein